MYFFVAHVDPGRIHVEIRNVAGEAVATLAHAHGGGPVRIPWRIESAAPAVYLYRITLETADGTIRSGWQKTVVVK